MSVQELKPSSGRKHPEAATSSVIQLTLVDIAGSIISTYNPVEGFILRQDCAVPSCHHVLQHMIIPSSLLAICIRSADPVSAARQTRIENQP